jgi:hypothetical protein
VLKKLFILVSVLFLLAIGVVVYAALNVNKLVESVRPQLESQASKALGTKVRFASITFDFLPSPRFTLSKFSIGESSDDSLSVQEVRTHLEFLPLLSGALKIKEIAIVKPHIVARKTEQGFSIAGLPQPSKNSNKEAQPSSPKKEKAEKPQSVASPIAIELENFSIIDAKLTLVQDDGEITLADTNLSTEVFVEGDTASLSGLSLRSLLLLNEKNIGPFTIESKSITANISDKSVKSPDITVSFLGSTTHTSLDFSAVTFSGNAAIRTANLDLAKLAPLSSFVPALESFKPKGTVNSVLELVLKSMKKYDLKGSVGLKDVGSTVAGHTISGLGGDIAVAATPTKASASTDALKLRLNESPLLLSFASSLQGTKLGLDNLTINGFNGTIVSSAILNLTDAKPFTSSVEAKELSIPELMKALMLPGAERMLGTVQEVKANISGRLGPDLMNSVDGPISLNIKDTVLKDINLLRSVLEKINELPFVTGALSNHVPSEFKATLASADTPFDQVKADLLLHGGIAQIREFIATNKMFELGGRGTYSLLKKNVDLETEIALSESLALPLIAKFKELSAVQNDLGQVVIPLQLRGIPPELLVLPNVKSLIRTGVKNKLKEKATEAIGNFLGF